MHISFQPQHEPKSIKHTLRTEIKKGKIRNPLLTMC